MQANEWRCELHDTVCHYNHPCYECAREIRNTDLIEATAFGETQENIRKKNGVKRFKKD
jgi:hypothetical protein